MNTVSVTGPGVIVGQNNNYNQWQFPVIVNGQAGVATIYATPGADYQDIVNALIYDLQQGDVEVGGIAENDSGTDTGGNVDEGDDDDDDSAVAGNEGDGSDFGDSV